MSSHTATIEWTLAGDADFAGGRYSREHSWRFDGGAVVAASPTPAIVPEPYSNPACVDPEEAFVASVASCHMLTFLHVASQRGFTVASYRDDAVGSMTRNDQGAFWISEIVLNPQISFNGAAPTEAQLDDLHADAHEQCFIANSVKTEILVG